MCVGLRHLSFLETLSRSWCLVSLPQSPPFPVLPTSSEGQLSPENELEEVMLAQVSWVLRLK